MKMTKQRKLVLTLLEKHKNPMSAEMLYASLPDNAMNLSTVYRILDFFFLEGIVNKTNMQNVAYYYLKSDHHHHYFICTTCQKMFPVDCHFFDEQTLIKEGFKVDYHDVTIYGTCNECQLKTT